MTAPNMRQGKLDNSSPADQASYYRGTTWKTERRHVKAFKFLSIMGHRPTTYSRAHSSAA